MTAAVIGIGSNSLRLLVAEMDKRQVNVVLRHRDGLRVFASMNEQREISQDMIAKACESVARLKRSAESLGAETIRLFATSAVRDAKNRAAFADALLLKTGLALDICSGEREAELSFLGAAGDQYAGMIDIGGGSTEIVIGDRGKILFASSLQAGAVRLYREMPIDSRSDAEQVMDAVVEMLQPQLPEITKNKTPTEWVGVGGTMTAAATCIQDIPWNSRKGVHGFLAGRSELRRVMETLAAMTPEKRRGVISIPPDRSDIVVHGFAILLACMDTLQINAIKISEQTNLDGYLRMITKDG